MYVPTNVHYHIQYGTFSPFLFRTAGEELGRNPNKTVFTFLLKKFRETLGDPGASAKEASLAVQGYGHLAGACKKILPPGSVSVMLDALVQRSEQV